VLKNFKKLSENGRAVTQTESADSDPPTFAVKALTLSVPQATEWQRIGN
jgi:hypothetical protein